MEACLSHEAALRWLLGNPNPLATGRGHACAEAPLSQAPTVAQARELARLTGLESLDVLVSSKAATRKTALLRTHLDARSLPAGSLIRVGGFSLCSPELVFLQMAATHDLIDTIRCGYALCSRYRLDNGARGGAAVRKAPDAPLTSRDRLERYLEASTGAKGGRSRKEGTASRPGQLVLPHGVGHRDVPLDAAQPWRPCPGRGVPQPGA